LKNSSKKPFLKHVAYSFVEMKNTAKAVTQIEKCKLNAKTVNAMRKWN